MMEELKFTPYKPDKVDLKILDVLLDRSDLNAREVGVKVYRSTTATYERIRHLRDSGIIKRFTIQVDRVRLGHTILAITEVSLLVNNNEATEHFERTVASQPEVIACFKLSGMYDFLLHISVRSMNDFNSFIISNLGGQIDISRIQTHFVLKEIK